MAYRFKIGEPVPQSIRRIALDEIGKAVQQLSGHLRRAADRDKAIHEARKSLKKLRGLLRLVRPELGNVYSSENERLRRIGHRLSALRDAKATVEIFDRLIAVYSIQLQPQAFNSIRRKLEINKRQTESKVDVQRVLKGTVTALTAAGRRVQKWPIEDDGFKTISDGLKSCYQRGKQAMVAAIDEPTPENYHEWRKRVKDHWYHVRLLKDIWDEHSPARESELHDLETWLGDDHNLAVLRSQIETDPPKFGSTETLEVFLGLLVERQKELRGESLHLGAKIYKGKPAHMVRAVGKIWKGQTGGLSTA